MPQRWTEFFDHVAACERLCKALLSRKAGTWFADMVRAKMASISANHLTGKDGNDLTPTVVGAVAVQAITWWLQHGRPCSAGEIAARTSELMRAIIDVELRHPS